MKQQIRKCAFETNSSSMHSLVLMKNEGYYTPEEMMAGIYLHKDRETGEENCVWEPWDFNMTFGRSPFKVLSTFADKWLYACASLVGSYNDNQYKQLVKIAKKHVPNLKKIKLPKTTGSIPNKEAEGHADDEYFQEYGMTEEELVEFLMKKEKAWGFEIEYWETSMGYWCYDQPFTGSVDEDILSGCLRKSGTSLEEFLTNKKYIVIQDGDEYCVFDDLKECGLIDREAIEKEYPSYGEY